MKGYIVMSSLITAAFAPSVNIPKNLEMSDRAKKNISTVLLLGAGGAGAIQVSKRAFGKSFGWNTSINNALKGFANKVGAFAEKNSIAGLFTKTKAGAKIGKFVQSIANGGAGVVQTVASKLAKTTGRQKLLGVMALGTISSIMAVREHFSKKEGENSANNVASKQLDAKDKHIEARTKYIKYANTQIKQLESENAAKDQKIANLQMDLELKNVENESQQKSIEAIEKAAEKIGVADKLAEELQNYVK